MSTVVVKLGAAVLGEWRNGASPFRPHMPPSERKVRQLRNSCSRLVYLRLTQCLALGEATGWALVSANIVGGMGKPVTPEAIAALAKSLGLPEIEAGILDAVALDAETARRLWGAGRHQLLSPRMVGALLAVTSAEREEARIRNIDAIDESAGDRNKRLARERQRRRRGAGLKPAPQPTQADMAKALGISLATWKRRHRAQVEPNLVTLPDLKTQARAHVSPARVRNVTTDSSLEEGSDAGL